MSAPPIEATTVGWQEFEALGLTHRRFLYWVRFDYLHPAEGTHRGSGVPMRFDPSELDVARWMLTLTTWGMELTAAADYARDPWLRKNLAELLLAETSHAAPPPGAAPVDAAAVGAPGQGGVTSPTPP